MFEAIEVPFGKMPDLIGQRTDYLGVVTCEQYRCTPIASDAYLLLYHMDPASIEGVGRLVEQKYLLLLHKGGGNAQTLLHAKRICTVATAIIWVEAYG